MAPIPLLTVLQFTLPLLMGKPRVLLQLLQQVLLKLMLVDKWVLKRVLSLGQLKNMDQEVAGSSLFSIGTKSTGSSAICAV